MRHWAYIVLVCGLAVIFTVFLSCFVKDDIICGLLVACAMHTTSYIAPIMLSSIVFDILRHAPLYITITLAAITHSVFYLNRKKLLSHNYLYRLRYFTISMTLIYAGYILSGLIPMSSIIPQLSVILVCTIMREIIRLAKR